MLEGLDLGRNADQLDLLTNIEYQEAGFQRARELFSLKNNDELIALFIVNLSDLGMNMSDLTNCVQIMVLEPDMLRKEKISGSSRALPATTNSLTSQSSCIPVLLPMTVICPMTRSMRSQSSTSNISVPT